MRALSLIEPWATLVAAGKKRYETRSWAAPPSAIGSSVRIAIHASKSREAIKDGTASQLMHAVGLESPDPWPLGMIIAVVSVTGCYRTESVRDNLDGMELILGNYGDGRYAWRLEGLWRLQQPIPCRGSLGLWEVPVDVRAQLIAERLLNELPPELGVPSGGVA